VLQVLKDIFAVGDFLRSKKAKFDKRQWDEELAADGEVYESDEEEKSEKREAEQGI